MPRQHFTAGFHEGPGVRVVQKQGDILCTKRKKRVTLTLYQPTIAVYVNPLPTIAVYVNPLPTIAVYVNPLPTIAVYVNPLPTIAVYVNPLPTIPV